MEGVQDFEYKKYVLLAYLQAVGGEFADYKLYPSFSDLIFHYRNLNEFKESKDRISDQFPQKLDHEAFRKLDLKFTKESSENPNLNEIDAIINYSLPQINRQLEEGKDIYTEIDQLIKIEPIGILPLYKKEGYILLSFNFVKTVKAFAYRIIFFENAEANYFGISFKFLETFRKSIANTFENMKSDLIKANKALPNPATYLLLCDRMFPEEEAVIPVAKRKMLSFIKKSDWQ